MRIACFLDTNVLIYAATAKDDDPEKYRRARRLVLDGVFGVSGQVLAEFYVNAVKKPAVPLSPSEAERWVHFLCKYPVAPIDATVVRQAVAYAHRYKITYWDAALIAAAERLDAPILYTEDLNHDQLYGSVRVVNPFRP